MAALRPIVKAMADESALEHPDEIYAPSTWTRSRGLTTYKDDVERLTSMAFFTDPRASRGPRKRGEERTIGLAHVDDESRACRDGHLPVALQRQRSHQLSW